MNQEVAFLNVDAVFYWISQAVLFIVTLFTEGPESASDALGGTGMFFITLGTWILIFAKAILGLFAIFFAASIMYYLMKLQELKHEHSKKWRTVLRVAGPEQGRKRDAWENVQKKIGSPNPADWRVAILDADVMLDELMQDLGYEGDNLGDRLKKVERSEFSTLDLAWDAHKVRNRIAHEGPAFVLDHPEATRVIRLFEEVFKEFDYID